jgi:hypothetical protein
MDNIYIVCTNKVMTYVPEPIDPISYEFTEHNLGLGSYSSKSTGSSSFLDFPIKPRFDPIMPKISPKPDIFTHGQTNNIVCVCKDIHTANHYLNGFPNRYVLGPYKIM